MVSFASIESNTEVPRNTLELESAYYPIHDEPYVEQNIDLFHAFGTPIYQDIIPINTTDLNLICECFMNISKIVKTVKKSNRGGWQSTANIFRQIHWNTKKYGIKQKCNTQLNKIHDYISKSMATWILKFSESNYFDKNGLQHSIYIKKYSQVNIKIKDAWFNINNNTDSNVPHFHPHSQFSGVIYLKIPKELDNKHGNLVFFDPRKNILRNNPNIGFGQFNEPLFIQPRLAEIVIFPSWLQHSVFPTFSNDTRISLSFNIDIESFISDSNVPFQFFSYNPQNTGDW